MFINREILKTNDIYTDEYVYVAATSGATGKDELEIFINGLKILNKKRLLPKQFKRYCRRFSIKYKTPKPGVRNPNILV